ncbi:DUF4440 domain-containing protein [candidate division KSB1 bacterium]|nr:DUF4440 domain-containing protein [candidate division KSB1 bacterium]
MKQRRIAVMAWLGLFCAIGCRQQTDFEKEKAELLELHRQDRQAHFKRDAAAVAASLAPEMISVRAGEVWTATREENRRRFERYFHRAEFVEWDDLMPPIIHISPDGQMAWMVVRVKVKYDWADSTGKKSPEEYLSAWLSVYEKQEGKWLHVANASTFGKRYSKFNAALQTRYPRLPELQGVSQCLK